MTNHNFFTIGGTVQVNEEVVYIERNADTGLLRVCEAGEFAFVLTARQMGKSSLMVRTANKLRQKNILAIIVDLTLIGRGLNAEQWYLGLIRRILRDTSIKFDITGWWHNNMDMGVTERLITFFEDILLKEVDQQIVIFLDEIDTTLSLDFTDDFYAAIRAIHNLSATNSSYRRLSFVLIGTATPADLIRDPSLTPFNVGREIVLTDFTLNEALPFVEGFQLNQVKAQQILSWIYRWTSGHPYLTQKLCVAVINSDKLIQSKQDVDQLVNQTFFAYEVAEDHNLVFVRDMLKLQTPPAYLAEVIGIYQQVHEGYYIADDHTSVAQNHLKLSGIVRVSNRRLIIRNQIYNNIFNQGWIRGLSDELNIKLVRGEVQPIYTEADFDLPDSYVYVLSTESDFNALFDSISSDEKGITFWHKSQQPDVDRNFIQQAIQSASSVLYIASPDALSSDDLRRELELSQFLKSPLIIGWVAGDNPIDAIPLSIINEQYIDLRSGRETHLAILLQAISHSISKTKVSEDTDRRNPYKGLRSFESADAPDFFGRTKLVEELKAHLDARLANFEDRFLAIIGASGSGKSSVIKAGLIPALRRGDLSGSGLWTYVKPFVPGDHPYVSLADALSDNLQVEPQQILKTLESSDNMGLMRLLANEDNNPSLIFIDQFEEIFTLTSTEEERDNFITLIVQSVTAPDSQIIVLIAMRADFFERPTYYPRLGQLISDSGRTVLEMSRSELQEAIEKPAYQDDVRLILDDGLVEEILYDLRDQYNQLPLLQFTLDQLFEERDGNHLTLEAYNAIGRVTGALSIHAQNTYDGLPSDVHRKFARGIFTRLIVPGESIHDTTRRRSFFSEFRMENLDENEIMSEAIAAFVNSRLLVTNQIAGNATLEVGHEALIREWNLLGEWITDTKEDIRFQEALTRSAVEWIRTGKQEDDRLYRGALLEQSVSWMARNIPSGDEREFIQASIDLNKRMEEAEKIRRQREQKIAQRASTFEERARQFRRAAAILSIVVVAAVVAALASVLQINSANNEISTVVSVRQQSLLTATVAQGLAIDQANSLKTVQFDAGIASTKVFIAEWDVATSEALAETANYKVDIANTQVVEQQNTATAVQATANMVVTEAYLDVQNADITVTQASELRDIANTQIAEQKTEIARQEATGMLLQHNANSIATSAILLGYEVLTSEAQATQANDIANIANTLVMVQQATADALQAEAMTQIAFQHATADALQENANAAETAAAVVSATLGNELTQQAFVITANFQRTESAKLNATATKVQGLLSEAQFAIGQQEDELQDLSVQEQEIRDEIESLRLVSNARSVYQIADDLRLPFALAIEANRTASTTTLAQQFLADQAYYNNIEGIYNFYDETVVTIAINSEGNIVATGGCLPTDEADCQSGEVIVWNLQEKDPDKQVLARFDSHSYDLTFNLDNSLLASANCASFDEANKCLEGEVKVWNTATWELVDSLSHGLEMDAVAFSPTSLTVLAYGGCVQKTGSHCDKSEIKVFDVQSNETIATLEQDDVSVEALEFNPSGQTLLAGFCNCSTNNIVEWDITSKTLIRAYKGHSDWVNDFAWLPDGKRFISASSDKTLILWNAETGDIIRKFTKHSDSVRAVDIDETGTYVISASNDNALILWDIEHATPLISFEGHKNDVLDTIFVPNSNDILSVSADNRIIRWLINFGPQETRFYGHNNGIEGIAISPDGKTVVSTSWDNTQILWDIASQQPIFKMVGHPDDGKQIAFSPDGRFIASDSCVQHDENFDQCLKTEVLVRDASTGYEIQRLYGETSWILDMKYSPDGKYLVTSGCSQFQEIDNTAICIQGQVNVRDGVSGEILQTLYPYRSWAFALAFSPDAHVMLTSGCVMIRDRCDQGEITVWDVATWTAIGSPLQEHSGWIRALAFHPNGEQFVSGSDDNTLIVWDLNQREVDGHPMVGHSAVIRDIAFSPDGRTLVSASDDDNLIVWDFATHERLATLKGHNGNVYTAQYTPDGNYVISGSADSTLGLWKLIDTPAELMRWTFDNRNIPMLSCAERRQFKVEPFCENAVSVVPTAYPTLTSTPNPDFAKTTATYTPSATPPIATYTPTATIIPSEYILQALELVNASPENGFVPEQYVPKRVIDMSETDNNLHSWRYFNPDILMQYEDFVTGTTFKWGSGSIGDGCGFNLRYQDNSNYQRLKVLHTGFIRFETLVNNQILSSQIGYGDSIKTGQDDTNELIVLGSGNVFSVYINGIYVAQFEDASFAEGAIALLAYNELKGDQSSCTFENSWAWLPSESLEAPPPPPIPDYVQQAADLSQLNLSQGNLVLNPSEFSTTLLEDDFKSTLVTNINPDEDDIVFSTQIQMDTEYPSSDCEIRFNLSNGDVRSFEFSLHGNFDLWTYSALNNNWREVQSRIVRVERDGARQVYNIVITAVDNNYRLYVNGYRATEVSRQDLKTKSLSVATDYNRGPITCTFANTWVWKVRTGTELINSHELAQAACQRGETVVSADSVVNVRKGPATSFERIGALSVGSPVVLLDRNADNTWVQVQSGSISGWVARSLICNS